MRVSLPHFGHAVDLVVSMTFFRSAVFAIFAIQYSPDRNVPSARRAVVLPGDWEVSRNRRTHSNQASGIKTRAEAVHCTRLQNFTRSEAAMSEWRLLLFSMQDGHKRPALVQRRRLPRAAALFEFCGDVEYDVFLPGPADDLYSDRQAFCRRAHWN